MGGITELGRLGRQLRKLKQDVPGFQRTPDELSGRDINDLGLRVRPIDPIFEGMNERYKILGKDQNKWLELENRDANGVLEEMGGYGSALGLSAEEQRHLRNVEAVLGKMNASHVNVIDATNIERGYGAPSYRVAYDAAKEQNFGPNVSTALTPINKRRRTSAMLSEFLHDPQAGHQRFVLDYDQPSSKLPLDAGQFYRLDPDEQLGFLAATEKLRFEQDLPEVAKQIYQRPLTDEVGASIDDAASRLHAGPAAGGLWQRTDLAWGPTAMKRAALTQQLLGGATADALPLTEQYLKGLGGYARGGFVNERHNQTLRKRV